MSRHLREMTGDDVGGLGRAGQRAVVDSRERHRTEPSSQPVCLPVTALRKTSVPAVVGGRILLAMADEVQLRTGHRYAPSDLLGDEHDRSLKHG